jgi:hypothetical protein
MLPPCWAPFRRRCAGTSHCSWPGITCDAETKRIVAIVVDSLALPNKLSGRLDALPALTALQVLRLPNSMLNGTLPAALGDLPLLSEVDLSGNLFSGPLPAGWSQGPGAITNLSLSFNNFGVSGGP